MKAAGDLNLVALSDGIDLRRVFASLLALLFPNRVDPLAHLHLLLLLSAPPPRLSPTAASQPRPSPLGILTPATARVAP